MIRTPALQIHRLYAQRGPGFTLDVGSLWVDKGRVLCVAGANGSGKTTLIEAIVGLIPHRGTIRIMGYPQSTHAPSAKSLFGYIPDDDTWIIPKLTAHEYFTLLSSIYERSGASIRHDMEKSIRQNTAQLKFTALHKQLGSLSHGNKKKVQIIAALIHEPTLLIVDELRNGLDPLAIRQAETLFRSLAAHGTAILAATHDLWWAERFADDIVMLDQGQVILDQATSRITAEAGSVEAKYISLYEATHD